MLATATTFVPGPQTGGTQLLVDFDMSITLWPGDTYVIEWLTTGDEILTWMGSQDDPYPYGNMFGFGGTPLLNNDLNFITYTG